MQAGARPTVERGATSCCLCPPLPQHRRCAPHQLGCSIQPVVQWWLGADRCIARHPTWLPSSSPRQSLQDLRRLPAGPVHGAADWRRAAVQNQPQPRAHRWTGLVGAAYGCRGCRRGCHPPCSGRCHLLAPHGFWVHPRSQHGPRCRAPALHSALGATAVTAQTVASLQATHSTPLAPATLVTPTAAPSCPPGLWAWESSTCCPTPSVARPTSQSPAQTTFKPAPCSARAAPTPAFCTGCAACAWHLGLPAQLIRRGRASAQRRHASCATLLCLPAAASNGCCSRRQAGWLPACHLPARLSLRCCSST